MDEEALKEQIIQLFTEMVRIEHTAVGGENKVRNELQNLLTELAQSGCSDIQEFITELNNREHHNLDFSIFCNTLLIRTVPSQQLPSELMDAVIAGDLNRITRLLRSGADVNFINLNGIFALGEAAIKGDTKSVETLLLFGAKVDIYGYQRATALIIAAREGHLETASLLLKFGANVNAVDSGDETSLHKAAQEGHKDMVLLLLSEGANPNLISNSWRTPLHDAVIKNNKEVTRILIDNGADMNVFDGGALSPLHYAIRYENIDMAKILLIGGADPDAKADQKTHPRFKTDTPFEWVDRHMQSGPMRTVFRNLLLEYGVNK